MVSLSKKVPLEKFEQKKLTSWCLQHPVLCKYYLHIANERKTSPWEGRSLQQQGVRKGVSDVFIAYPVGKYHGLWIELKRKKYARLSDEQKFWLENMNDVGYAAHVAYGHEDAISIIEKYLLSEL